MNDLNLYQSHRFDLDCWDHVWSLFLVKVKVLTEVKISDLRCYKMNRLWWGWPYFWYSWDRCSSSMLSFSLCSIISFNLSLCSSDCNSDSFNNLRILWACRKTFSLITLLTHTSTRISIYPILAMIVSYLITFNTSPLQNSCKHQCTTSKITYYTRIHYYYYFCLLGVTVLFFFPLYILVLIWHMINVYDEIHSDVKFWELD